MFTKVHKPLELYQKNTSYLMIKNELKRLHLNRKKKYMDPVLIKVIQFFLSLSLLIVLHELGHFVPARMFGTRVEKFFLFFDIKFALFKKKIGETVYLSLIHI